MTKDDIDNLNVGSKVTIVSLLCSTTALCTISGFMYYLIYRYIMFGRGICEKYQSRDEKFSLKTGIFRKYPSKT